MKSTAYNVFAVLLLASFSVWVGCSHNVPVELSNLQRELNEKENEIKRLTSENDKKDQTITILAGENSEKDSQLKDYQAKLDQQMQKVSMQDQSSPEASLIRLRPIRANVLQGFSYHLPMRPRQNAC